MDTGNVKNTTYLSMQSSTTVTENGNFSFLDHPTFHATTAAATCKDGATAAPS